ncbi:amidohydrolase family protein [Pedobacter sp. D749]|uniref:amidohydrolase family protein n=1 Tax=Pedobacter sp. D749 TaxID=2856523 RepID=UPI001C5603F5|nr:amidohydrolase family protein [Pedobacter sp. D749]QXU40236.1 amidohydrolase family protein [Pedobacter sp. D749]
MTKSVLIYFILTLFLACKSIKNYDLIITNAKVLNIKTGEIKNNQTILISNGYIEEIESSSNSFQGKQYIDAKGQLVSPSFIDTHIHPTDILGDYEKAPITLNKDSLNHYRQKISNEYLPYGTTTVLTMGQPEKWLTPLLEWQKRTNPNYIDFYISGGALISKENRVPYIAHTEVVTAKKTKQKILQYYNLGIRHLKLYYRLKEPEFSVAVKTADSLKMKVYGHIGDFSPEYLTIKQTLKIGLTNYEHLATIPNSVIISDVDKAKVYKQFKDNFGEINSESKLLDFFLEQYRFIDENKKPEIENLIKNLSDKKVTISTTIHRLYEQIAATYFTNKKDTTLTPKQLKRLTENFAIMMKYAKIMQESGIKIRLGSDMPNGGKVNISELIILAKYGFNIIDIFRISSYNGAEAIGIENQTGSIEKGKKADLILWSKNPFDNYENFNSKIIIIKDGKVYKKMNAQPD